jgi:hypothetical protein
MVLGAMVAAVGGMAAVPDIVTVNRTVCSTLLILVPHVLLALARLSPVAKQLWIDALPAVHFCAEEL